MLIFIKIFFPACHIQLKEEEKKKVKYNRSSNGLAKNPADISAAGRCSYVMEETEEKPKGLARELREKLKKWEVRN